MGWVGASVAISILHRGLCQQLLINDVNENVAEGEAMDLNHGSSFFPTASVVSCKIEDMLSCKAIVITAGRGGTSEESRLDLLRDNIRIAENISQKLKGFQGILVIVSNPVDVLTYYYQKFTGLPPGRVIGTGTMLDTARLRDVIGKKINVDPKSVHANVIAEHGDSEVILWSSASIGGLPLRQWYGWELEGEPEIMTKVRDAALEIIKRKGATNHAIGLVTATLLKWILRGERRVCNVATVLNGAYGLENVALSLPTLISEHGADRIVEVELSPEESEKLHQSATVLKKAIASV